MGIRALVLCADIGEGHITVARELATQLQTRPSVDAVGLRTDLSVMGKRFGGFMTRGFEVHLDGIGWTYDLAYRVFFERSLPRTVGHLALAAFGQRGLRRALDEFRPDVVVTEYPLLSAALGQLRAMKRLSVPVCSSISDPAGLYYWAHPGIDLHLLSWPEAAAEVERIAGPGRSAAVRPPIAPGFLEAPDPATARAQLDLPATAPVVVVSGGGWGMGDLVGAVEVAQAVVFDGVVLCLTGRSEPAFETLSRRFARQHGVRVVAFTSKMPQLLAAADALIHTTGGTTALEARAVGCPLVNYGSGVAHVLAHARALAEWGIAEWAPDRVALSGALRRALAGGRRKPPPADALPDAADLVLRVAMRDP